MRQALLEGDMDAVIGAFFPTLSLDKHLIKPFNIPKHWPRFMALDWGACGEGDPFSIGWYAIADGTSQAESVYTGEPIPVQRDCMVCYRRWNGSGLPKVNYSFVSDGIKERERGENILFRIAGGDILEQRGHGESIFGLFSQEGLNFVRADMRRLNGWEQVQYRIDGANDYPLSLWFEECEVDLESIGSLQHDLTNPNDTAKGNDHDADRHRYACMTRPITRDRPAEQLKPMKGTRASRLTPADLTKIISRRKDDLIPKR